MAREVVTPTLITIMFMLLAGLYGFVKFSHENDFSYSIAKHCNATVGLAGCNHLDYITPTLADGDGLGLKTYLHNTLSTHQNLPDNPTRPLITYVYTESLGARDNLKFFIDNALHGGADFIFILNGPNDVLDLVPDEPNIGVVSQSSKHFDLSAHGDVLRRDGLWKMYTRFIILSSDIRGPFLPYWSRSCWSDVFLNRVTKNVKLVGMTANCLPKFHIQSTIWATDSVGMKLLLNPPEGLSSPIMPYVDSKAAAFRGHYSNVEQAISSELKATAVIQQAGYKVDALMAAFHKSRDYEEDCARDSVKRLLWGQKYQVHPYETVFVEAKHNADSETARLTKWHRFRPSNGSWDVCF
ncbi:hypothetical protein F4804DRAFT_89771 [Jackrogersella minutella]|nr:hypothetical protein F4804DRAFT_89771 [Jackrogersella minutella]